MFSLTVSTYSDRLHGVCVGMGPGGPKKIVDPVVKRRPYLSFCWWLVMTKVAPSDLPIYSLFLDAL